MNVDRRIMMLLALLFERSPAGGRRRLRLSATGGVAILVAGFLLAVGLGRAVELALAAGALVLMVGAAAVALPRVSRAIRTFCRSGWIQGTSRGCRRASRALLQLCRPALLRAWARTSRAARAGLPKTRDAAALFQRARPGLLGPVAAEIRTRTRQAYVLSNSAATKARVRLQRLLAGRSEFWSWSHGEFGQAFRRSSRVPHSVATPLFSRAQLQREALRLNAAGTQLRRRRSYPEAAEQHRAALEILRGLGDQRSVALTLNNLALALSHDGDDATAVALFEEAATILRQLGERQDEGRVIANLGLTHRRHGRREEANNVLGLALAKLAPASSAYHKVEAELRRAS